jgi:formylglycine-generating enzyme required for sulfatase activity
MSKRKRLIVGGVLAVCLALVALPPPVQSDYARSNVVLVPAGTFTMGSTPTELANAVQWCQADGVTDCAQYFADEQPAHAVYTDPFYIDIYPTTNAEYAECVAVGVCDPPHDLSAYDIPSYYGNPAYANCPVVHVNWFDADTYCRWRNKRLLTEAEWEKAARFDPLSNTVSLWPWGDFVDSTRLNLCDESCAVGGTGGINDGYTTLSPVGAFPQGQSYVGAYDMAGNVWQWVADYYDAGYYAVSPSDNPTGPATGTERVKRGGGWNNPLAFTRSANRKEVSPSAHDHALGIRCGSDADDVGVSPGVEQILVVGGQAVVQVIGDTLALRTGPDLSYLQIGSLYAGTTVQIVDGPRGGSGYLWWYVRTPTGEAGWAVEEADGIQTLVPVFDF